MLSRFKYSVGKNRIRIERTKRKRLIPEKTQRKKLISEKTERKKINSWCQTGFIR